MNKRKRRRPTTGNLYGYSMRQVRKDPKVREHLAQLRKSTGSQANHQARRRAVNPT